VPDLISAQLIQPAAGVSGAKADRQALVKVLKKLGKDDVLVFTKMDRLARSTRDLLNILEDVSKTGAKFKYLDSPMLDTTTPHGALIVQVLGAVAEFERKLILARTREGRTRAMANGIKFGRKNKLNSYQIKEALQRRANGEMLIDISRSYNVSRQTIGRL
jgi:DNA invertase Pin-like site-specific DNA recombinase